MGGVHGVEQFARRLKAGGVGAEDERPMAGAERAGRLAVVDRDAGVADRRRQHDERRHPVRLRAAQIRQCRAVMRVFLAAAEEAAGLHHLVAGLVDRRRLVVDRAEDGVAVGGLRHEREGFADFDAGYVGSDRPERPADVVGGVGLGVPGVELAGAADQEEKDAIDILRLLGRVEEAEVGQRQADGAGAERADLEGSRARVRPSQNRTPLAALEVQHDGSPGWRPARGAPVPNIVTGIGRDATGKTVGQPGPRALGRFPDPLHIPTPRRAPGDRAPYRHFPPTSRTRAGDPALSSRSHRSGSFRFVRSTANVSV